MTINVSQNQSINQWINQVAKRVENFAFDIFKMVNILPAPHSSTQIIVVEKETWPKHSSSDGRAGDLRSKGPGFNPHLDPMQMSFKI